jgi:predicted RNase H-like nuclease (RuvC/YqgF family)
MSEEGKSKESKIRPRRLEYVKFVAVEYYKFARDICSLEEAGRVLQDLINSMYHNEVPEYPVNRRALEEADEYILVKRQKIKEYNAKRREKQKQTPIEEETMETGLFNKNEEKSWRDMPRHELEKMMTEKGITPDQLHKWHEETAKNNFADKHGNEIRNPVAACKSFTRQSLSKEEQT